MRVKLRNPPPRADVAGPATVRRVLEQLEVNPETVLVIHDGELVTRDRELPDEAEVEVRPVISGGAGPARCQRCRGPAAIEVPRHRAAWCAEHFVDHVQTQVRRAIDEHRMCSYDDAILVAVSGGKDSLALWDILLDMGYRADGLYLGLGIGGYSARSEQIVRAFADRRGVTLHLHDLADRGDGDLDAPGQRLDYPHSLASDLVRVRIAEWVGDLDPGPIASDSVGPALRVMHEDAVAATAEAQPCRIELQRTPAGLRLPGLSIHATRLEIV
jgi:sulfur carrier protein ThiS